jgi:Na+-transporting methylmalonyl-CoA/oxaloacetate decarboxylase beta subunit
VAITNQLQTPVVVVVWIVWMYLVTEKCPSPTLLLPHSLVLAAVLVVVTGARVALAPSHGDADRHALAPVTTTWTLIG